MFSGDFFLRALNTFPNKLVFLCICRTSLLKTVGKGEIDCNKQFLLFPQHFYYSFGELFTIFLCCLQTLSVGESLKWEVWERVTTQDCVVQGWVGQCKISGAGKESTK